MDINLQRANKFRETFLKFKDKKIVLYGIGDLTFSLLEYVQDYNIIGLLDRNDDLIGKQKYGFTILNRQDVENRADLIIINTHESYWRVIYARIKDWSVPIYTLDGRLAKDIFIDNFKENVYWKKTQADLEEMIEKYDIISFDIFDTLLMRKVYNSMDGLLLVESRLKKEYGENFAFLELRNKAMSLLHNPTIDELYEKMQQLSGWNIEKVNHIKQVEISTDRKLIVPRSDVVEVFEKANKKKKVFLVSDMYYTAEMLLEILQDAGIQASVDQIIVSCDYKASKADGTLWKRYKQEFVGDKKALHIGDDVQADRDGARNYGIDAYYIMSATNMLENSSFSKCASEIKTLEASVYIGVLLNKIFNSPFSLCETKGDVDLRDDQRAGYCLYGGVTFAFIMWLIERSKKDKIQQLLFLSRDAYFLKMAFENVCAQLKLESVPEIVYLETSKRVLTTTNIQSEADVKNELQREKFRGAVKELLYNRFSIVSEECDVQIDEENYEVDIDRIVQRYGKIILERAISERKCYLDYLKSMCIKESAAIVDLGQAGTIQYLLNKLLDGSIKGYYFSADLRSTNPYSINDMQGCFQIEADPGAERAEVNKKKVHLESFFTAPNGTLLCVDENGEMVYGKKLKNQIHFDVRNVMFAGIIECITDMLQIYKEVGLNYDKNDAIFIDKMFGIMIDGGFRISQRIKDGFYMDAMTIMTEERAIWE